jgi:hypothetical protein
LQTHMNRRTDLAGRQTRMCDTMNLLSMAGGMHSAIGERAWFLVSCDGRTWGFYRWHARTSSGFIDRQAAVLIEVVSEPVRKSSSYTEKVLYQEHEFGSQTSRLHASSPCIPCKEFFFCMCTFI